MTQRSDGRRNREALVRAAEQVFADRGVDAALGVVAEQAGLGRGTLYRHFADRYALVAAVYELRLTGFEALAADHADDPDAAEVLLRAITGRQSSARGMTPLLAGAPRGRHDLQMLTARTRRLFAAPVARGRQAGRLAPDATVDDFVLVIAMVEGIVAGMHAAEVDGAVARGVELALCGLRPR